MKHLNLVIIALLAGITIFSVVEYISSVKSIEQFRNQISVLENENQNLLADIEKGKILQEGLTAENEALKANVSETQEKFSKLEADLDNLQKNLSVLESENLLLKEENRNLGLELARVSQDKEILSAKILVPKQPRKPYKIPDRIT